MGLHYSTPTSTVVPIPSSTEPPYDLVNPKSEIKYVSTIGSSKSTSLSPLSQDSPDQRDYKRVNHFKQYLKEIQSLGSPLKDQDLPRSVKQEIKQNPSQKQEILRKHSIKRADSMSPEWVPNFTVEEEQLLIFQFEEFSKAYDVISDMQNIKSFLIYPYVLCKLCDSNGIVIKDNVRDYGCSMSMIKMVHHESICKKVYQYIGWEFTPWEFK